MTELMTRPTAPAAGGDARPAAHRRVRPLALAGPFRAVACAGSGLAVVEALVLLSWATGGRTTAGAAPAARVGADLWLLGHGGTLRLPPGSGLAGIAGGVAGAGGGTVGLVPLGVTVLLVLACWRGGGRLAADRYRDVGPREAARVVAALAPAYALTTLVVALLARGPGAAPGLPSAVAGSLLLAGSAGAAGAWRAHAGGPRPPLLPTALLPTVLRPAVRGARAALLVLVAGGALLAGVALAARLPAAAALFRQLGGGVAGGLGLLLVQLALLPDLVIWAACVGIGPGFALGAGTSVGIGGVHLAGVPGLPVFAALPHPGDPPGWSVLVLLIPVAAGITAGLVVRRDPATAPPEPADGPVLIRARYGGGRLTAVRHTARRALPAIAPAALAGVGCGVAVAAASLLASGPVGNRALSVAGPSPWRAGLLAAAEVGAVAVLTVLVAGARDSSVAGATTVGRSHLP